MLRKILVADDSLTIRTKIAKLLTSWGYQAVQVEDGNAAFQALLNDPSLEIAIIDWQMPGLEGPDLCRLVRERICDRYVYIVMFTAQAGLEHLTESLGAGADDYVRKTADHAELRARVLVGERTVSLHRELLKQREDLSLKSRLESIGQLAAGIAHEINTPLQYLGDNLSFVSNSAAQIISTITGVSRQLNSHPEYEEAFDVLKQALAGADYEFLAEDLPNAIRESREGVKKIGTIVEAVRRLTDSGVRAFQEINLNQIAEQAITVTESAWKYVSRIDRHLDQSLATISAIPSALEEAVVQLLMNSVQAIKEKKSETFCTIVINTRDAGEFVELEIADNGCGIPSELQGKVFDPFFTTKEGSKGQGLALVQSIVVNQHRGRVLCDSKVGLGSSFRLMLPKQ